MKITVLIAHYNNGRFFKDCYDSLCKQTYADFNILIVDDVSTDDSLSTIKRLTNKDSRVKILKNDQNMGVGFTKKKLAESFETEIGAFLDPDDALTENAIEIVMQIYKEREYISATYSRFYYCDAALKPKEIFKKTRKIKPGKPDFFNIHFEIAHFFTFKKEAYFKTEGINPHLKTAEDQDFYLKMYETGKIHFINLPIYYYRVHQKGLSHDTANEKRSFENWHLALKLAAERRGLAKIYNIDVNDIQNLPEFLFKKESSMLNKIIRKFS